MKPLNRTHLAEKYPGKWLALKMDRMTVVGSGTSPQQALQAAQKKGFEHPVLTRMPKKIMPFIGFC